MAADPFDFADKPVRTKAKPKRSKNLQALAGTLKLAAGVLVLIAVIGYPLSRVIDRASRPREWTAAEIEDRFLGEPMKTIVRELGEPDGKVVEAGSGQWASLHYKAVPMKGGTASRISFVGNMGVCAFYDIKP